MKHLATACCFFLLFSLILVTPVLAVVPGNDTYAGRTVITTSSFRETIDTSEATTDADDDEMNMGCVQNFEGVAHASVWYEYTASEDREVLVEAEPGTYFTAGLIVATGSPGAFALVACGLNFVIFAAATGQTYVILAYDDQPGVGGDLQFHVGDPPAPIEVDLAVDANGTFDQATGVATLTGTISCPNTLLAIINFQLEQTRGRNTTSGSAVIPEQPDEIDCANGPAIWSVEVAPSAGSFRGGPLDVATFVQAFNRYEFVGSPGEASVQLRH